MRILYVGDVMGKVGIEVMEKILPALKQTEAIDVVIAQAENVTDGKGLSLADYQRLKALGVDGFTGGNHTIARRESYAMLENPQTPVTGPANMPDCPGPGYKYVETTQGKVLIISILGQIVGRDADKATDNPLKTIDQILLSQKSESKVATIVNFHGDFSSEKVVFGHYLDGKVTAVIGDHWHVPTADAQVQPKGTAHQSDVGMCGSFDSSLGVTFGSIITRWYNGVQTKNTLETNGRRQFNALLIESDDATGLAIQVRTVRKIYEN